MDPESPDNFDETFVTLVRSFPRLYDTSMVDYHDASARENSWIEIASRLGTGITPAECRTKWSNLYETFESSLSIEPVSMEEPCSLMDSLEFLRPFIELDPLFLTHEPKIKSSNGCSASSQDCKPISEAIKQEADVEPRHDDEFNLEIIKEEPLFQEPAKSPTGTSKYAAIDASDSDSLFLLSLLPDMKQMSEQRRQLFKARLLEINEEMVRVGEGHGGPQRSANG